MYHYWDSAEQFIPIEMRHHDSKHVSRPLRFFAQPVYKLSDHDLRSLRVIRVDIDMSVLLSMSEFVHA